MKSSSDRIETLKVKAALVAYFRFHKNHNIVCTEFSYGSADVLSISPEGKAIFEVEVKVSIADMNRELKKEKPALQLAEQWPYRYFYFAVPEYMKSQAREFILNHYPLAGLYVLRDGDFSSYGATGISSVVNAKAVTFGNLHYHVDLKEAAIKGMANNIASLYSKLVEAEKKLIPIKMNLE